MSAAVEGQMQRPLVSGTRSSTTEEPGKVRGASRAESISHVGPAWGVGQRQRGASEQPPSVHRAVAESTQMAQGQASGVNPRRGSNH